MDAERAVDLPGWLVRCLLNKEDPIGLMNQKPPHILILSEDFGRQKSLGLLHAAQKFRSETVRIVALFEDTDSLAANATLCDAALAPPWRTAELRSLAAQQYAEITGKSLERILTIDDGDHMTWLAENLGVESFDESVEFTGRQIPESLIQVLT